MGGIGRKKRKGRNEIIMVSNIEKDFKKREHFIISELRRWRQEETWAHWSLILAYLVISRSVRYYSSHRKRGKEGGFVTQK